MLTLKICQGNHHQSSAEIHLSSTVTVCQKMFRRDVQVPTLDTLLSNFHTFELQHFNTALSHCLSVTLSRPSKCHILHIWRMCKIFRAGVKLCSEHSVLCYFITFCRDTRVFLGLFWCKFWNSGHWLFRLVIFDKWLLSSFSILLQTEL